MGESTQTSTVQSQPTNPKVTATTNNLLTKLDTATNAGVPVFNKSLFAGAGDTTQKAWQSSLDAANSPDYMNGVNGALKSFGNAAAGNDYGTNDPGYAALRQNTIDDTQSAVNQQFNASGRFGGGSHVGALGEGIGKAVSALDYGNFQNDRQWQAQAAGFLPSLYGARQAPSALMGNVGAAQDANTQGALLGQNDLYQRVNGAPWDTLGRASSILNGTAASGGTTTTSTQPSTPWWQSILGLGVAGAGAFL